MSNRHENLINDIQQLIEKHPEFQGLLNELIQSLKSRSVEEIAAVLQRLKQEP